MDGKKRPHREVARDTGGERAKPPDTGLLYSVGDVARLARVSKAAVIRLCLAGQMPEWIDVDGWRYWDGAAAAQAVAVIAQHRRRLNAA